MKKVNHTCLKTPNPSEIFRQYIIKEVPPVFFTKKLSLEEEISQEYQQFYLKRIMTLFKI